MKKILAIVFMLTLLLSTACAQTISSGEEASSTLTVEEKLVQQWEAGLSAANDLYGKMFWALDYVDAWTDRQTWERLVTARNACILIAGYLEDYVFPELTLTDDEIGALAEQGFEAAVLQDYSLPQSDQLQMYSYFRTHIFCEVDTESIYAYALENTRELAQWMRNMLLCESEHLRMTTNYLYLPLVETAEEGALLWSELQTKYPLLFPQETAWESDQKQLEAMNAELALAFDQLVEEELAVSLSSAARLENALMDLEDGVISEMIFIEGTPAFLPVPVWYDPEKAKYLSYCYEEGKDVLFPACGDSLTAENVSVLFRQEGVSLAELEAYLQEAEPFARTVQKEDQEWILLMDGYALHAQWENDAVEMTFMGEGLTFAYW